MGFWPTVMIGIWKEGSAFDVVEYHEAKAILPLGKRVYARYTALPYLVSIKSKF